MKSCDCDGKNATCTLKLKLAAVETRPSRMSPYVAIWLFTFSQPLVPPQLRTMSRGSRVKGERQSRGLPFPPAGTPLSATPPTASWFSLGGRRSLLLNIWLPPELSFGGKTRMFLFPRGEEELRSETTELKHREAS